MESLADSVDYVIYVTPHQETKTLTEKFIVAENKAQIIYYDENKSKHLAKELIVFEDTG